MVKTINLHGDCINHYVSTVKTINQNQLELCAFSTTFLLARKFDRASFFECIYEFLFVFFTKKITLLFGKTHSKHTIKQKPKFK